jgi:hypothetical protein
MNLKSVLAAVLSIALSVTTASAYVGDWYYDDNPRDTEIVELGDNNTGEYLTLYGYKDACGPRGDSYATMRSAMSSNYPNQVVWWVEYDCGSTLQICIEGTRYVACSTYRNGGWRPWSQFR